MDPQEREFYETTVHIHTKIFYGKTISVYEHKGSLQTEQFPLTEAAARQMKALLQQRLKIGDMVNLTIEGSNNLVTNVARVDAHASVN